MASHDAVIISGANPFFIYLVKMPYRKDARTSEKPFKCRLKLPFPNITFGGPWPSHGFM